MTPTVALVTELIERYGALQNPREVMALVRYLGEVNPPYGMSQQPTLFVEVGVWRGGNAAILKTFFPKARYIGVDILDVNSPEVSDAPALRTAVERFGLELVQGDTGSPDTVERVRQMIGEQRADYMFIDASHDYDSVKRDYQLWSPLAVRVGFHDVHNPMVYRFWQEVCAFDTDHARTAALWKEMDGHGIGVVWA